MADFEDAVQRINASNVSLSNENKLKLYGYYKQATIGDNDASKPALWEFTKRAKWDAWNSLKGTSQSEAKDAYVEIVSSYIASNNENGTEKEMLGLGISTSTLRGEGAEDVLSDVDKTSWDWIKEGNIEEFTILLKKTPSILTETDAEGLACLHWACDRGHLKMVQFLLESQADVNCKDNEGQTPLHYACLCEHLEIVKLLVASEADINVKDSSDLTPFDSTEDTVIHDFLNSLNE
eukprot:m.78686 g.78686  ORF g.78686 m.78686 type:complete len:236 (+) comp12683_c0_seq1:82-789(+)